MLKTATLSTDIACPAFRELQLMAVPILRVAVEPTKPLDLPAVVRGLKLLNQADACVQVCLLCKNMEKVIRNTNLLRQSSIMSYLPLNLVNIIFSYLPFRYVRSGVDNFVVSNVPVWPMS